MKTYDLNLLWALHVLLESGSVTAAAERLHLSVPATSHTLARLRDAMGDPLLVRAGRKLVPTPRALALQAPVARLVAEAQALAVPASRQSLAAAVRHFVVRVPEGISIVFGAALLQALQQDLPLATLNLVPEAHGDMGALRDGRIDLDVGNFRIRDPEIQTLELSRQQLLVALRPEVLPAGRLTLRRYAAMRHLAVAQRPGDASPVDEALAAHGLRRQVVLTVPSAHTALVAASRSQLATTVSSRIARAMAPGLGLQLHELPLDVQVDPLLMAWHPRHGADPAHACLRDCVQRVITDPRWSPPVLRPGSVPAADPETAAPTATRRAASGARGRSVGARARP